MTKSLGTALSKRIRPYDSCDEFDECSFSKRVLSEGFSLLKITNSDTDDRTISANDSESVKSENRTKSCLLARYPQKQSRGFEAYYGPNCTPPIFMASDSSNEKVYPTNNGGRYKYARKVDFLIDEIIRKSRRTYEYEHRLNDGDWYIPNTLGPQPTTDRAISVFRDDIVSSAIKSTARSTFAKNISPKNCNGTMQIHFFYSNS